MNDGSETQADAPTSPGSMLKTARETEGLSEREVADRLFWMPGYPAIIERDDYQALRRPAFARGYVKAYGKMLALDEKRLLAAFDRVYSGAQTQDKTRVRTRPLQLQSTGVGVVIGLVLLALLVVAIWWWRAEPASDAAFEGALDEAPPTWSERKNSTTGAR